jgi:hypothetical protein
VLWPRLNAIQSAETSANEKRSDHRLRHVPSFEDENSWTRIGFFDLKGTRPKAPGIKTGARVIVTNDMASRSGLFALFTCDGQGASTCMG